MEVSFVNISIKQFSSLDKIRSFSENETEIKKKLCLKGEVFSFQQAISCDIPAEIKVTVKSELKEYIKLYEVKNTVMDLPCYRNCTDNDYITKEAGVMPDILIPLEEQNGYVKLFDSFSTIWIELCLPTDICAKNYEIMLCYDGKSISVSEDPVMIEERKSLTIEVLDAMLPKQQTIVTQWFHTDCIASVHNVEIFSERHWKLIEEYMLEATRQGINMILVPVITPPLDTKPGISRPNVQLVKINKDGDIYTFDFTQLKHFIDIAKKCGMKYFEIAHLFSQWGAKYSPNIYVTENGKLKLLFGWHINANDPSYKTFLEKFLPELVNFLKIEGIFNNCYFHISDEPEIKHLDSYRYACDLVKPFLKDAKIMDAISNIDLYNLGLVSIPVTSTDHIEPFLDKKIKNQWVYYCCCQGKKVANRFIAMPSYRNRILGIQLYKYSITGFLQWGFNFYYSNLSSFEINPYITTSEYGAVPSGDAFSVYPGKNGPIPSLRAKVFKEAIQDISVFELLEKFIGKNNVIKFIEEKADMEITFSKYPRSGNFLINLDNEIKEEIRKHIDGAEKVV